MIREAIFSELGVVWLLWRGTPRVVCVAKPARKVTVAWVFAPGHKIVAGKALRVDKMVTSSHTVAAVIVVEPTRYVRRGGIEICTMYNRSRRLLHQELCLTRMRDKFRVLK
eukprot:COSAG02_NODE_20283_length_839_cov_2.504054_1_plen_111_part_00